MKLLSLSRFFIIPVLLYGCAGSLRPGSDWRKLDEPPAEADEIAAELGPNTQRLFESEIVVWYSKGTNEYLIYTPPSGLDGACDETALTVIKVGERWKKESDRGYICVD